MRKLLPAVRGGRAGWRTAALLLAGALVAAPGLASPALADRPGDPALVMTDRGPVRGTVTGGYREFSGIPYAAPPLGELRWASPQPPQPWTAPLDATEPGDGCAQEELPPYQASQSEDCLYLNVTTPRHTGGKRLPVMVWLHGGGFSSGSGHETLPRDLVTRGDVVVVTINYRLGVLGFLAHPALDGGRAEHGTGNFGLEDQQAALRWVRRNAAAFGGDPRNVTLFGQWSGARGVCANLASPAAAGLFHKAILMSMPCTIAHVPQIDGRLDPVPPGLPRPRAQAERHALELAGKVGCADPATAAACLRAKPAAQLVAHTGSLLFTPTYGGGGLLPEDPIKVLAEGRFTKVPVLHGVNRDAYRTSDAILEAFGFPPLTAEAYVERVRNFAGPEHAGEVLARYPVDEYDHPSLAWSELATDALIARPMMDTNAMFARHVPTYAYEFADPRTPWYDNVPEPTFPTGSYQDGELQYLFDTVYFAGRTLDADQRRLSGQMIDYWTRFARTGDPNGPGMPYWAPAARRTHLAQSLAPGDGGVRPVHYGREHDYRFWRSVFE